jgi:hypothetical protein
MRNDHSRKVLARLRDGHPGLDRHHQRADVGTSRGRRACCGVSQMSRHTIYILLILAMWFFVDSVDYWLTRTPVHTVPERHVAKRVQL